MLLKRLALCGLFSVVSATTDCQKSKAPQYCVKDVNRGLDACVAIDNKVTSRDIHITVSALYEQDRGWLAFGAGSFMRDSLMLVFYPSHDSENLTASVRSTAGHIPPELDDRHKDLKVISNGKRDSKYYQIEVVCYSCLSGSNTGENWIWSHNHDQDMRSKGVDGFMHLHTDYGSFGIGLDSETESSQPRELCISSSRATFGTRVSSTVPSRRIHGSFMAIIFLLAFPFSTFLLRQRRSPVKYHSVAQTVCAILFGLGILHITLTVERAQLKGPVVLHAALGTTLMLAVPLQWYIGYRHHSNFNKGHGPGKLHMFHRVTGPTILVVGLINVSLGALIGDFSQQFLAVGLLFATWAIVPLSAYYFWKRSSSIVDQGNGAYSIVPEVEGSRWKL